MMRDIRRICESPTEEDRRWFPDIAGSDWLSTLDFAMRNFKDESFIAQYLSPQVIRDMHFFSVLDDDSNDTLNISAIHDESGYRHVRGKAGRSIQPGQSRAEYSGLVGQHHGDRSLTLRHNQFQRRPSAIRRMKY